MLHAMDEQPSAIPVPILSFDDLGLLPVILESLKAKGITNPSPIQHAAIPSALSGQDVLGIAQTGTGKTFAFGLPMLQRLSQNPGFGLVLLPTRELAEQVEQALKPMADKLGIKMAVFIGGASMELQRRALKQGPRVLVATPGRLIDHLDRKTVTLKGVSVLVLDEADRMLDMGFAPQLNRILGDVPKERQTMLFSATMPQTILGMTAKHMKSPVHVEIAPSGTSAERVEQHVLMVGREEKGKVLVDILNATEGTTLVFVRTKHGAKKLTKSLLQAGHKVAEIHANRSLGQRREALEGFKKGRYRILVATDIAARGIDVTGIALVVNFDLPQNAEDYVHRIGRTGRAGLQGEAVSFITQDQRGDLRAIERLIRKPLPMTDVRENKTELPPEGGPGRRPQRGGGGQRRGTRRNFRGPRR